MTPKEIEHAYRIQQLERQVKGMQRQLGVTTARMEKTEKQQDQRIRDLEIKTAVSQGLSQRKVAQIYELTPGRVSQIMKKNAA